MPRYKLILEYDGSAFSGWQAQPGLVTVQGVLEQAAGQFSQQAVTFFAAGRTDRGVHASGQVAHVDFSSSFSPDAVRRGLNFYLKSFPVVVLEATEVELTFHARFSAQFRSYHYRILNRPSPCVLSQGRAWWIAKPLDVRAMKEGSTYLVGHHDFSSFRAADCQAKTPWRTLDFLDIDHQGEYIDFYIQARSFLHHQVRIMIGALKWVGEGRWNPQAIATALKVKDRKFSGPTAPAQGLYLTKVGY